jgi:hypothetical protein
MMNILELINHHFCHFHIKQKADNLCVEHGKSIPNFRVENSRDRLFMMKTTVKKSHTLSQHFPDTIEISQEKAIAIK